VIKASAVLAPMGEKEDINGPEKIQRTLICK
jgi:hypothetical protein